LEAHPIKEDLSQINAALKHKPEAVDGLADKAKGHIHDFFGCGPKFRIKLKILTRTNQII